MNRLSGLFEHKKNILSVYFTAGYPALNDTAAVIRALSDNEVDLVEIGFPFSDPLADGPTIQQSSVAALGNGITTAMIFDQLTDIRKYTDVPLVAMGYLNPVLQFGMENFLAKLSEAGIDGLILPDLPAEVYEAGFAPLFKKYGISLILLITPQTPESRMRYLDDLSEGFLYMVSSAGTTGAKSAFGSEHEAYFGRIREMGLRNPCLIGFGISNRQTFETACKYAAGGIVGSAYIKAIEGGNIDEATAAFTRSLRAAQ